VRHEVDEETGLLKGTLTGEEELEHCKKSQMVSARTSTAVFVVCCLKMDISQRTCPHGQHSVESLVIWRNMSSFMPCAGRAYLQICGGD
jgi:hypothetical protein